MALFFSLMGKHQKLLFIIEFVYILCQWLIKMSFLAFYLRVLSSTPLYRLLIHLTIGFTTAQTVAVWLFYGLQCIPLDAFFHPALYPNARCIPTPITLYIPASLVSCLCARHGSSATHLLPCSQSVNAKWR